MSRVISFCLLAFLLYYVTACTFIPPREIPDLTVDCEDPRCVMEVLDEAHTVDERRYDGLNSTVPSLVDMYDEGIIELHPAENPVIVALGAISMSWAITRVEWDHNGDINKCKVWYLPDGRNYSLSHELLHCKGYKENMLRLWIN